MRSFRTHTDLSEQTQNRLIEISEIKNYFMSKIKGNATISKKLDECVTILDYADIVLIALAATNEGMGVLLHANGINKPAGIIISVFTLMFSLVKETVKNT